jgi:ABC-type xylose transport system permease subunit
MSIGIASSPGSRLAEVLRSRSFWQDNGTLIVLVLFVVLAAGASGGVFLRPSNLTTILYQASIIGVLVLGQTLVVIAGGLDLSMVAVLILSAVIMGGAGSERQSMMMLGGLSYLGFWPALVAGFAAAALAGLVNGIMVARLHIPAFITTLARALFIGGIVLLVTGGSPIYYPDRFFAEFGRAKLLGLPAHLRLRRVGGRHVVAAQPDRLRAQALRGGRQRAGRAPFGHLRPAHPACRVHVERARGRYSRVPLPKPYGLHLLRLGRQAAAHLDRSVGWSAA